MAVVGTCWGAEDELLLFPPDEVVGTFEAPVFLLVALFPPAPPVVGTDGGKGPSVLDILTTSKTC